MKPFWQRTLPLSNSEPMLVYNDTATREIHYLINGKNASRTSLVMKAYRCVGSCLAAIANVVIEDTIRYWSSPDSWKTGKVPLEGEDAIVQPGYNIIYDIVGDSPIINNVQINGRVSFMDDGKVRNLRARYLFVRMGELIIGNSKKPYLDATITLFGDKQDEALSLNDVIEAGNKIIANTALFICREYLAIHRTRLLKTANKNDTKFLLNLVLDWKAKIELHCQALQ
jgi:hypothetical protein